MNSHRPNIYTEAFNIHKRSQDPNGERGEVWGAVLWIVLVVILIGVIGSWFVPN